MQHRQHRQHHKNVLGKMTEGGRGHLMAKDIIRAANSFVGVKYRHQGRSDAGLDCAGLIIATAKRIGLSNFDTTQYSTRPNAEEFTREMIAAGCTRLPVSGLKPGDILRITTAGWPVHIAIYEIDEKGNPWYIHAYLPHKKVTRDPLTSDVWDRVSSVWRFPEKRNEEKVSS